MLAVRERFKFSQIDFCHQKEFVDDLKILCQVLGGGGCLLFRSGAIRPIRLLRFSQAILELTSSDKCRAKSHEISSVYVIDFQRTSFIVLKRSLLATKEC